MPGNVIKPIRGGGKKRQADSYGMANNPADNVSRNNPANNVSLSNIRNVRGNGFNGGLNRSVSSNARRMIVPVGGGKEDVERITNARRLKEMTLTQGGGRGGDKGEHMVNSQIDEYKSRRPG